MQQRAAEGREAQGRSWAAPFFTLWTGQAFSLFGSQIVHFALVWWLTEQTGSATVLATASLFGILPQILLSPFAGALVDRWNRRIVMIVSDSVIALLSLGLAFLFLRGQAQIWHIYAIMLLRSAGGAFHWPAMQASTSLMVPKEQLTRVGGLNQTLQGLMSIAAPPLGAMLMELMPVHSILLVDVVTAALAVVPLLFVAIPQPQRMQEIAAGRASKTTLWTDLAEGFRYVANWPGMLIIGAMATLLNCLITPAFSLMPLLVSKHFGGEAIQLGIINSAWGIGMLAGGLILSIWGGFKRRMATTLMGLIGMGTGFVIVGATPSNLFWLALVGTALAGFMTPMTNGPLFAVVQSVVAPEMQGRVMSLMNATATAMSPLGLALAGRLTDAIGLGIWYYVAGIVCVIMGLGGFFLEPVMALEVQKKQPEEMPRLAPPLQDSAKQ
jgi:DHA3 family macrolide efflux protein-like MFS transporter